MSLTSVPELNFRTSAAGGSWQYISSSNRDVLRTN